MNVFFKTTLLTITCLFAFMVAKAQPAQWRAAHPNIAFYKNRPIDTTKTVLTPAMRSYFNRVNRLIQLGHEHFLLNDMGAQNLGIRFKSKAELYEGLWDMGKYQTTTSVIIDGKADVELIAQDVNPQNAKDYLYRVIQNDDRELVGWTVPSQFRTAANGKFQYAYLGNFNYQPEQLLKIEIYNIKNYREQDGIIIDWRKVVAAKLSATVDYLSYNMPLPDNGLLSRGLFPVEKPILVKRNGKMVPLFPPETDFLASSSASELKVRLADSIQRISFDIANAHSTYNYKVSLKRTVDGRTDSINLGETNVRFGLYKEFWKQPGKYQVTFTPKIHRHGGEPIFLLRGLAKSISFTVLPPLNVSHSVPVSFLLLIVFGIVLTGGVVFIFYRSQQKRLLFKESQNQQIVALQLKSVRAQLNPHFIFNALAGIQNLMNKNEVENANKYLARFARLTRNVLDNSDKELVTIEHETTLLKDYLQMEQMRFGFKFTIQADEEHIDPQTEIPAMLLQPFIENAVKHGVSALKHDGIINVSIQKKNNSLLLSVEDNGGGFANIPTAGMGFRLCQERIKLLNSQYKKSTILLHKSSETGNTHITIELKNWLNI
ncbi:sensor histidine kinase [Mucilaginibacter flavus]|uniref:sensor histidine kinase n=1 Tax=Mucilaginibacter flavus TaxID=931504 RepID=UPI0025B6059E|nr:histidine kinase [Mucilaginibacter flavus]MDN3583519.1 histidine kinase [Mucilaginibacter flavus]